MKKFSTFLFCLFLVFSPLISRCEGVTLDDIYNTLDLINDKLILLQVNTDNLPAWSGLYDALSFLEVNSNLSISDHLLMSDIQSSLAFIQSVLDGVNVFNFEERLWDYLFLVQQMYDDIYGDDESLFDYLTGLHVEIDNLPLGVEVVNWDGLYDLISGYPFHVVVDGGIELPDFPSSSFSFDYSYLDDVDSLSSMLLNGSYYVSGNFFYWDKSLDKDNTPADVRRSNYYIESDWFSAVHQQLLYLLTGQDEMHQTVLTILWKLCANDDDVQEMKEEVESRSSELSNAMSEFSQNDVSRYLDFSPPSVLTENKFSGASSKFQAQCPEELTLDLQYFIPSQSFSGSNFRYQFNIDLSPYQSFFSTCRTVALVMWWLVSFLFSFFVFRLIYKACASCSFYFLKITGNL